MKSNQEMSSKSKINNYTSKTEKGLKSHGDAQKDQVNCCALTE